MRLLLVAALVVHAQSFDVASVRANTQPVGPDYNNRIRYASTGFSGQHVTLARLIAEAYRLQLSQISGPAWIHTNEYEIEARAATPAAPSMLRGLLVERFQLKYHVDSKMMSAYELTVDRRGFKTPDAKVGYHFQGDMRQFADLIGFQLSIPEGHDPSRPTMGSVTPIPVIDKTGLTGTYDFHIPLGPTFDIHTVLREQLGLRLENRRVSVQVLIVDSALQTPTGN